MQSVRVADRVGNLAFAQGRGDCVECFPEMQLGCEIGLVAVLHPSRLGESEMLEDVVDSGARTQLVHGLGGVDSRLGEALIGVLVAADVQHQVEHGHRAVGRVFGTV